MGAENLDSADTWVTYTSFGADIDLVSAKGRPCRRIRINASGNLALKPAENNDAAATITGLNAGDQLDVKASKIMSSGTTVTSVTVFW